MIHGCRRCSACPDSGAMWPADDKTPAAGHRPPSPHTDSQSHAIPGRHKPHWNIWQSLSRNRRHCLVQCCSDNMQSCETTSCQETHRDPAWVVTEHRNVKCVRHPLDVSTGVRPPPGGSDCNKLPPGVCECLRHSPVVSTSIGSLPVSCIQSPPGGSTCIGSPPGLSACLRSPLGVSTCSWRGHDVRSQNRSLCCSVRTLASKVTPHSLLFMILWILVLQIANSHAVRTEKVCESMDVRNMVTQFSQLENCTVIEGSLQILLIDYANPSEYNQITFPDLVEVTEYMLLYRVYGLKSLSQIFPNLAVIRGQTLFFNYALVAFEMPDMEELGLWGLTQIVRGAVRIEKNPKLCYMNTVDWDRITNMKVDNFFIENKDIDECVDVCPRRPDGGALCPVHDVTLDTGEKHQQQLCWTGDHCQKVCPVNCGSSSCFTRSNLRNQEVHECCHSECLGGCRGPRDTDCMACKHIFYNGRCVSRCPPQTYEYHKRRCITEAECRSYRVKNRPVMLLDNNRCVEECPSGYITNSLDENLCQKCDGPCPKVCQGLFVDSVSAAQQIKGCTIIKGVLEIHIRGGKHVGKELEANLGEIEEVTDYVAIKKAYALTNLRFLKNLRLIRGNNLFRNRYALVVIDNQNLKDIWDFNTHPNLTIGKGHAFFHFNRKLCLHLIDRLIEIAGINGTDTSDVNRVTNGDLIPCHTEELKLEVVSHLPTYAIIRWTNFFLNDHRELLGYVVNLREAPSQNVTMYDSRDACGTDEWKQEDVKPDPDKEARFIAHIVFKLKPFTQYAVYVQTFTVARATMGAMSPIIYFTTDPDVPWPARDITVTAELSGELRVQWKAPLKPNGNVTHYYVYWQPQPLNRKKLDQRNYCIDKLRLPGNKGETIVDSKDSDSNATQPGECCACPKSEAEQVQEEEERLFQIKFEDYLHDSVYIKRPMPDENQTIHEAKKGPFPGPIPSEEPKHKPQNSSATGLRLRRSVARNNMMNHFNSSNNTYAELFKNYNFSLLNMTNMAPPYEEKEEETNPYEVAIIYGKTEVILPNLRHFQEYSIEVIACHDYLEGLKFKRCSNRAITTHRTIPDLTADQLDERNITVTNDTKTNGVILRWEDPVSPNGLIVTYELQLSRVDVHNYKPYSHCITHKQYWVMGGYRLDNHPAGNWSFRIRATSLAGNGSWTNPMYFYVSKIGTPENRPTWKVITGVSTCVALVIVLIVGIVIWVVTKKRFNSTPSDILYASVNPEYWSAAEVYIPDEWEVTRENIQLLRELGQGSFGMVYEGIAKDIVLGQPVCKVAIKTVNEKATMRDRIEFLNEASVMKVFDCNHVVKLRGVVSKGQPTLVIMELMANGDLKSFLRSLRPDSETPNTQFRAPTLKDILQMAGEIADGMSYLTAMKFVHRDLAARNCMVSENLVVKIGDFGMTREIYENDYYRKGGKGLLPVRWMSPESLKDGIFSSLSDVWSYGVVLWEMATLAAQPYQGLSNEEVLHFVIDGGIMLRPEGCPDKLYNLMQLCWRHNPKERSTFNEIIESLVPDLNPDFRKVSYFFSEAKAAAELTREAAATVQTASEGDDENADDSLTPLTSSPRHHGDMLVGEEEVELGDALSTHSTLSYKSQSSDETPRCGHRQPCTACVMTIDEGWPSHRKGDVQPPPPHKWSPTHRRLEERNCHSPPGVTSNEGSKGSSKSNDSAYSGVNGFVNGHVPRGVVSPNC